MELVIFSDVLRLRVLARHEMEQMITSTFFKVVNRDSGDNEVLTTTAAFRNGGWSSTYAGAVSYNLE